jgi:hypothetical protein
MKAPKNTAINTNRFTVERIVETKLEMNNDDEKSSFNLYGGPIGYNSSSFSALKPPRRASLIFLLRSKWLTLRSFSHL